MMWKIHWLLLLNRKAETRATRFPSRDDDFYVHYIMLWRYSIHKWGARFYYFEGLFLVDDTRVHYRYPGTDLSDN